MSFSKMLVKSSLFTIKLDLSNMKVNQSAVLSQRQRDECVRLGQQLARLRIARKVKQTDAALRAGLSRNTVYRLEKGDPGLALGQVLRYLEAIAPGSTLWQLLSESDPALLTLAAREQTRRVRGMTEADRKELDF